MLAGATLSLLRGDTLTITVTGLGTVTGRDKMWFTLKSSTDHGDTRSLLQIEESLGLVRLNGNFHATADDGILLVTDASLGDLTLTLSATATRALPVASGLYWDIQMLEEGVVTTLSAGRAAVVADVTRAVS